MRSALSVIGVLAIAAVPAAADLGCVSDIRDAAPDGSFCHGHADRPQGGVQQPVITPQMHDAGTSMAGAVGDLLGGALVPALPPVKNQYGTLKDQQFNEKIDDGSDSANSSGVKAAQDLIKGYSGPLVGDDDSTFARAKDLPKPASKQQADATNDELQPFLKYKRTPGKKTADCPSGCRCSGKCTPDCSGTCYSFGGKDADPAGAGLDCSGLIGQSNPCFWYNTCKYTDDDVINAAGEHALLRDAGPSLGDLDDIGKPRDLRAGDVAFFNLTKTGADGTAQLKTDDHVVQISGNPVCTADMCIVNIVEAPYTGRPVSQGTLAIDNAGHVSQLATRKDGTRYWKTDTGLTFNGGGTPPPNTGKTRDQMNSPGDRQ